MNTEDLVVSLTRIAQNLSTLVAKENGLLRSRQTKEMAASREEKTKLTAAYETHMAELKRRASAADPIAPQVIAELKVCADHFKSQLDEHRRLVQSAKSVTERMLEKIVQTAGRQNDAVPAYDHGAAMRPVLSAPGATVSLSVNQVV